MSFNHLNYIFTIGEHYKKDVIFILFPFNQLLQKELIEKFPTVKWRMSKK